MSSDGSVCSLCRLKTRNILLIATEIAEHTAACDLSHSSSSRRETAKDNGDRSESVGLKYGSNDVLSDFVTLVCDASSRRSQVMSP